MECGVRPCRQSPGLEQGPGSGWAGRVAVQVLKREGALDQRPEGTGEGSHADSCGEESPDRGNSKCKGPEGRVCLAHSEAG